MSGKPLVLNNPLAARLHMDSGASMCSCSVYTHVASKLHMLCHVKIDAEDEAYSVSVVCAMTEGEPLVCQPQVSKGWLIACLMSGTYSRPEMAILE